MSWNMIRKPDKAATMAIRPKSPGERSRAKKAIPVNCSTAFVVCPTRVTAPPRAERVLSSVFRCSVSKWKLCSPGDVAIHSLLAENLFLKFLFIRLVFVVKES
jgi:hypothetical protein